MGEDEGRRRRSLLLGVVAGGVLLGGVVAAVVLVLGSADGLGADDPGEATPAPVATSPQATGPERPPRPVGRSVCDNPLGLRHVSTSEPPSDPKPGIGMREVIVESDGDDLTVTIETEGPVPVDDAGFDSQGDPDVIQWVVWLMDGEELLYQLRVALDPLGWQTTFDVGDERVVVHDGDPKIDGDRFTVTFDLDWLIELGPEFGWVAVSVYDYPGFQDVCPAAAHDSLAPDVQVRFPG